MKLEIKNKNFILGILAFLGLAVSIELTYIYYVANFLPDAAPSFCSINEVINCDAVAKTAYSVFWGIPQSVYGIFYYLFIIFLTMFPFSKFSLFKNFKNPQSYVFSLSTLAMIVSVALWAISTFVIHKICILCYILYGVNFFMLVFSKLGKSVKTLYKETWQDFISIISEKIWMITISVFSVIALVLVISAAITGILAPQLKNAQSSPVEEYSNFSPHGNVLGSENPVLVINEYTDFQCPYCSFSNEMISRLVMEVDGVQVIHHDFPLNKECNPTVKTSLHKFACKSAYYARAAKMQGKYWDYISLLFANQDNLSDEKFIEFGKKLNLDINQLKRDANSQEVKDGVKEDLELAKQEGVRATPTYVMYKGMKKYKHEGLMPYPQLYNTVMTYLNN